MKKIFTILLFNILSVNLCKAQHYEHFTFWSRVALQKKLNDHWTVGGELHWRRQSDFQSTSISPFALEKIGRAHV